MVDVGSLIITATFFIIFGIFLFYDFFRSGEKWGFFAYIAAVIPANMLWYIGINVLIAYIVLFMLWNFCLVRDLMYVYRRDKDYDDIILFLGLAILVHVVLCAILPAPQVNPSMQENTEAWAYFYFPAIYDASNNVQTWVDTTLLMGFRAAATLTIFLAIWPMIIDIKESEERISLLALIIIDAIFILPFLWLAYIWVGPIGFPLTFLFCVILLIVLLMLTREK
jgi:hypothetical protein